MAKLKDSTVHLTDENGAAHDFGPEDELPSWAEAKLVEAWGRDREDIWAEAPKSKAPAKAADKAAESK